MSLLTDLARKYKELKDLNEAKKEELSKINADWTEVENQLLEAFVEEGVNSIKIEGMGNFVMRTKNYLSVNAANKPTFFDYLRESGNEGLLKLDVNPRTLTSFLGTHLEDLISKSDADPVEARKAALEFLNQKGASYFSEKGISVLKA